jgi:hypothetical protein
MKRAPSLIPTLLRFPGSSARQDAWGRLLTLNAGGAMLTTAAPLMKGETVLLTFELGSVRFVSVPARAAYAEKDGDGHCHADLRWADMVWQRRIAKALVEILARA